MSKRDPGKYPRKRHQVGLVNMTQPFYPNDHYSCPEWNHEPFSNPARDPFVVVTIDGGEDFPDFTQSYFMRYHPGISVGEVLSATNLIGFNQYGRIVSVSGVPIGEDVGAEISLNGRVLAANALAIDVKPGDTISLELFYL